MNAKGVPSEWEQRGTLDAAAARHREFVFCDFCTVFDKEAEFRGLVWLTLCQDVVQYAGDRAIRLGAERGGTRAAGAQ